MKGQTTVIILLIAVGLILYFLLPYLRVPIGPPPEAEIVYSNDIITIEDYFISNTNPYAGSTTTIEFFIRNNGDREVERVEVNFFDLPGFKKVSLKCDGEEELWGVSCTFLNIESQAIKRVALTLEATKDIALETPFTISFYIKYPYRGFRTANIPIVGETERAPSIRYRISEPSYGPVVLDFELPPRERKEDGVVRGHWAIANRPFPIKFNFRHVGSPGVGIVQPINITEGAIAITTTLEIEDCPHFKEGNYISTKPVLVGEEFSCNFYYPLEKMAAPEILVPLDVRFNYTYTYLRKETLTIRPER